MCKVEMNSLAQAHPTALYVDSCAGARFWWSCQMAQHTLLSLLWARLVRLQLASPFCFVYAPFVMVIPVFKTTLCYAWLTVLANILPPGTISAPGQYNIILCPAAVQRRIALAAPLIWPCNMIQICISIDNYTSTYECGYRSDLATIRTTFQPVQFIYSCRDAGDGLFIVKFKVRIHVNVFRNREALMYKYVVFSRRNKEVGHPYEYLYGAQYGSGTKNRALMIPQGRVVSGGK